MSSYSLIVRLPSGTEYWYAAKVPDVGDTIIRHDVRYVVTECESTDDEQVVVTLAVEPIPAQAVPIISRSA